MNEHISIEHIRKVNRETQECRKFYLDMGYKVKSDYGGMLTMILQEWPHVSVVIDRSKGYVVETIYPES
jgi:hypothetical protein